MDQTLICLHRHCETHLGVISGLLAATAGTPALGRLLLTLLGRLASALGCRLLSGLAAGTPALGGGLLGATLLGCHADKDSCKFQCTILQFFEMKSNPRRPLLQMQRTILQMQVESDTTKTMKKLANH